MSECRRSGQHKRPVVAYKFCKMWCCPCVEYIIGTCYHECFTVCIAHRHASLLPCHHKLKSFCLNTSLSSTKTDRVCTCVQVTHAGASKALISLHLSTAGMRVYLLRATPCRLSSHLGHSTCMSVCLSVSLCVCLSVYLSVCPSVCLSVCMSVCTSV